MKTPEGKVKDDVKKYLTSIGAFHWWPVQSGYGSPMLDCICSFNGKFIAIEVKAPGKTPTPRQARLISEIQQKGGLAVYIDDVRNLADWFRRYVA